MGTQTVAWGAVASPSAGAMACVCPLEGCGARSVNPRGLVTHYSKTHGAKLKIEGAPREDRRRSVEPPAAQTPTSLASPLSVYETALIERSKSIPDERVRRGIAVALEMFNSVFRPRDATSPLL